MSENKNNEQELGNSSVERHVSIGDAASILGVSIDTVRRWEKAGKLKAQRLDGKNRYFAVSELEGFNANRPMSSTEVAKLLEVSASTVRRLDAEGRLSAQRSEKGKRLYDRAAVMAYAAAPKQEIAVQTDSKGAIGTIVERMVEAAAEVDTALQNELQTFKEVEQSEAGNLMNANVHLPFSGWKVAFYLLALGFGIFTLLANVKLGPNSSSILSTLNRSDNAKQTVSQAGVIDLRGLTVGQEPGNLVVLPITSSQIKDGSIEGKDIAAGAIGLNHLSTDLQQQLGKISDVVVASIPGPIGPQGVAGAQGSPGVQGPQGIQGPAGPAGSGGITGITAGSGLSGGGTTGNVSLELLNCASAGEILKWDGSSWACNPDDTGSFSGTLAVSNGGTGANSFTAKGLLYGNGTGALQATGAGTAGQIILANASGTPTFTTVTGDITLSSTGVSSLKNIVGLTAGTYGSSTQVPQIVIDTTGRITGVTNTTITGVTPGGSAGGDLNGTYPNPSVVKINGNLLGSTTPTSGNLLVGDGTTWSTAALSGDITLNGTGVVAIQSNAVALGADTTGNYVGAITAGTGLSVSGAAMEGWNPTIAVLYGSTATTAARGNTSLSFTGTGNLTGSVTGTAGGGITTNTLNVIANPTFTSVSATAFTGDLTGNASTATLAADSQMLQGQNGAYYRNASNINAGTLNNAQLSSSVSLLGQSIGTLELEDDAVTDVKIAVGTITNNKLANSGISTSFGTNLSGSASVALGGTLSINLSASPTFGTSVSTPSLTNNGTLNVSTTGIGSDIVFNSSGKIILSGFDCTSYDNGGVLTVSATGQLVCDNDDGGAAGTITGSGATNRIPIYTGAQSLGSSWWLQNGSTMQLDNGRDLQLLGGNVVVNGTVTATTLVGAGSGITGLNATNIGSGTLNDSRLSANVTVQGNTFNGASQLVQLTVGGALPALNGSALTSVNAALLGGQSGSYYLNLGNASGSLSDARLSANVTLAGNTFNGNSQLIQTTVTGLLPALDGSLVTGVNADLLDNQDSAYYLDIGNATGTLGVARIANTSITNAKLQNSSLTVTAGTGITGGGSVALGSSTTLSVQYGAVAGTAVQGNTQITLSPGVGLSGGGTLTLGSGGSTTFDLDINGLTAKTAVNMDDYIAVYDSTTSAVKKISRADWLSGIIGALQYQGTWNAATNTPTLSDSTGTTGEMYAVSTGGTVNFGSGAIVLTAGDFVIHNGSVWQKAPSGAAVTSVFGRTGSVTAQAGDYTATQVAATAGGNLSSTNVQAALNELDTEKLGSLNGLTAVSQTFANDTNVTINSSGSTHTISWNGQLSVDRGGTGLDTSTSTGIAVVSSGSWGFVASLNDSQISDTLTIGAGSTVADSALSANVTKLGSSIQNAEVDDNLTISASGSVADGALSVNVSLLGASIQDAEVDDDLTISAAGSVDDGALSANVTKLGNTIDLASGEVSGTLKATSLQAATTDLGAADVTVDLSNSNGSFNTNLVIDGSITAGSFVGAITGNATTASALAADPTDCAANTYAYAINNSGNLTCSAVNKTSLANSGSLGFTWSDSEISDTLTLSAAASVADGALSVNVTKLGSAIDLATSEVSGNLRATNLQVAAADLGAADVNLNFSNTNGSFNTNLTIDGTITAGSFSGTLSGNATTATALAVNPADCSANQFANAIAANGNLSCASLTDADVPDTLTVGASSTVADGALSVNVTKLGSSIQNSEVDDDLTISAAGSVADGALSVNVTKLGSAVDLATSEVSGQLRATNLQSSGLDLGAADVNIDLSNTNSSFVTNLTVDGTVTASDFTGNLNGDVMGNADTATALFSNPSDCVANTFATTIEANGDLSCSTVSKTALASSGTLGFTWSDAEVSNSLTSSIFIGSGSTTNAVDLATAEISGVLADANVSDTLTIGASSTVADAALSSNITKLGSAIDLATSEVSGNLKASNLQATATDLGAADVTINLSNTNGSFNTNLTTDGIITAGSFSGNLTGNASTATALFADPSDCSANTYANAIAASGALTCASITDAALSANVTKLGPTITKDEITGTGTLGFTWADSEVSDTLTVGASSTVADGALSVNVTKLGSSIQNSEVDDDLTISAAGSVADAALSANVSKLGSLIDLVSEITGRLLATNLQNTPTDLGAANVTVDLSNSNGSFNTSLTIDGVVTAGSFSGNLTGNVTGNASTATALAADPADCAANTYATTIAASGALTCASITDASLSANVTKLGATITKDEITGTGVLGFTWSDSEVADTLTIGASSTVADAALSSNVTKLGATLTKDEITNSGVLGFTWGDSEVADTLTIGASSTVADGALSTNVTKLGSAIDLATSEVSGQLKATNLQNAGTDLGAANVNVVLTNTNGSFVTNLTTDGTVTATSFSGALSGNATTATALAADPSDCATDTYATTIVASGNLSCSTVTKTGLANSGTLAFSWSDAEVSNTLTASILVGSGSTTNAVDLATAEVAGNLKASNMQNAAADLGAADVNINLGNTNGSFNTNLVLDGTITSASSINTTGGALQLNGTDINTAGTLTNVAYKNQGNTFSVANTFSAAGTALTVNNNATVSGTLVVGIFDQSASSGTFKTGTGAVSLNGNTSVTGSGTLTVGGLTTLSAGLGVTGTSTFTGNIATSNGNVLIQQAAAGATMIIDDSAGKIGSLKAGSAKVAFLFDDSGNFSIGKDTRTNIAAANLAGTDIITILGSSGNVGINDTNPGYTLSVGGTFNVAGAATLASTLNVTGTTTLAALSVGSTLNVTGVATLSNNLSVGGTLSVTGTTTLAAVSTTSATIGGGGTAILKHLSTIANNVVSANIAAQGCATYGTVTLTGAALGDSVVATPWAQAGGIETTTLTWSATVSAANTVIIRACNPNFSTAVNTADTQEWRIDIWQH